MSETGIVRESGLADRRTHRRISQALRQCATNAGNRGCFIFRLDCGHKARSTPLCDRVRVGKFPLALCTNAMLARTTFGVAENSQHLYGRALDVRFATNLPDAVAVARAMRRGGVGWYPRSGFIHLNTGPVRNWDLDIEGCRTS
jgi:hypothetical protein